MMAPLEEASEVTEVNIDEQDADDNIEPVKVAKDTKLPSKQEVECHRCTHIPYRSWCRWCVMGRGRGVPHRGGQESTVPLVGIDYFFITSGGVHRRSELEHPETQEGDEALNNARKKGELIKCVLVRCFATKCLAAHCIPCKGADEEDYVAGLVAEDIMWLGHSELIIKGDNERALQALITRVLEVVRVKSNEPKRIGREEPAAYDSQSNGATEVGVMLVRGLFRTLKLCLEARIGKYVPPDHPLVPWLLQHTCLLLNVKYRGADGLTAWARARGRSFTQQILGFGESVLYKLPAKGPGSQPDGNMGTRWKDGIFIGYNKSSNAYILSTENGLVTSRSLSRLPEPARWSADALATIKATPWSERERPAPEVRFQQPAADRGATADTALPTQARRFRINDKELREFGFTDGCPQCAHVQRYGKARPGGKHSEACRVRLTEAIAGTEAGKARLDAHSERIDRAIAEYIEHQVEKDKPGEGGAPSRHGSAEAGAPAAGYAQSEPREVLGRPQSESEPSQWRPPPDEQHALPTDVRGGMGLPADEASPAETSRDEGIEAHWGDLRGGAPGYEGPTAASIPAPERGDEAMGNDVDENGDINMNFIGNLEPQVDDFVSDMLLQQIGSSSRSYRREAASACSRIVSEMYSPPRVTRELARSRNRHLVPGFALDLTVTDPADGMPWDFTLSEKRERARALVRSQKPFLLIGSPECRAFCTWQALNESRSGNPTLMRLKREEATLHLNFMAELYMEQVEGDRYFLHEHPRNATSWAVSSIQRIADLPNVDVAHGDQCQYGAEVKTGMMRGSPIMKPSGFMSNSPQIIAALSARCEGRGGACSRQKGGRHALCSGRVAREAAKYPRGLCRAILKGATRQLREDGLLREGCFGIQVKDEDNDVMKQVMSPERGYSGAFKDDLTGQVLRDDLVKESRAKELLYFHSKGVWRKVPRTWARRRSGRPPISVRWVDVNKGDEQNPNYRSRLVARQMKALDKSGHSYFAPAPPLEALRTVLSLAMTRTGGHQPCWDPRSPTRTQISFIDIKRAYFNAKLDEDDEPVYVDLPKEDEEHETMCAQLLRHMYATRMAADGWQEEYSTMMIRHGFRQGVSCPNVFYHAAKGIVCSVHGDDFTSSGPAPALDWFEAEISKEYEVSIGPRLGPGPNDAKEGRALNRVIRWCDGHLEYEADPRQAERLIAECGLAGSKPVATPSIKPAFKDLEEDTDLPQRLHTAFRGAAARANYLAADRIDAQFACKEICRWMSRPTEYSWQALKRMCRFLCGLPRLVYVYPQQSVEGVDIYTDTDWAGCPKTRKSTSGGCVMIGSHTIKHWSATQASISLSSGEAEFAGVIRGAGQGLGYQALLADFGIEAKLRVWTDSTAALGICSRQGLGKLRHLDTHTLWIQQAVRNGRVDLRKIAGERNPADLLTKHSLSRQRMEMLVELHGCGYRGGRAESAPQVSQGRSTKSNLASESIDAVEEGINEEPFMPHLVMAEEELDTQFPSIVAPEEELLGDNDCDENDAVYQHGMKLAGEIARNMQVHGRRRKKMSPIECVKGEADLNIIDDWTDDKDERKGEQVRRNPTAPSATRSSVLRRRRSVRRSPDLPGILRNFLMVSQFGQEKNIHRRSRLSFVSQEHRSFSMRASEPSA